MVELSTVVAVIIGISELFKVYVPNKYIPLVSMILGLLAGLFVVPASSLTESIMTGITLGLSASGVYDMTKVLHKK